MKKLILILSLVCISLNASAQEISCTKAQAREAENSASRLHNWNDIYKSFKKFRHCDDGAIAEGYSESVVRMLSDRWNELRTLTKLTASDKDFYAFVLRHIDATTDKSQVEKIIINCSKHCPKSMSKLCSDLEVAAKNALSEFK